MSVNLFAMYKQEENHFTNSLVALLRLSAFDGPKLMQSFFGRELKFAHALDRNEIRVLQGYIEPGTHDAEFCGKNCCVQFETKIRSASLVRNQVKQHLKKLRRRSEKHKRLVLLTPDDSTSEYVQGFVKIDPSTISHLEWGRVYKLLDQLRAERSKGVFRELVRQFLEHIRGRVSEQDMAGIIAKVQFSKKSQVDADVYLNEMKSGDREQWNTPRQYKNLDGTGRKLMLYDKNRGGITVEVEIRKVERANSSTDYPWTNWFAGKPTFFQIRYHWNE